MMDYQDAYAGMYNPTDTQYGTPYQGPDGKWYDSRGNLIPGQDQNPQGGASLNLMVEPYPAPDFGTAPKGAPDTGGVNLQTPAAPATPNLDTGPLAPFTEPAPELGAIPKFSFDAFKAPSFDEALNDPGYQFRVQQGQQSLGNWAAARGTLNDSDTGKMFIDYGQNAAEQGYGAVYARDFGSWQGNEQAAERQYGMNRQTQYIDPFTAAYNAWTQRGNFYLGRQGNVVNGANAMFGAL